MSKSIDVNLGKLIKQKREFLKLTQQEVADYVNVSKSAVSRWESGDIASMGMDKVQRLSDILEISPLELINIDRELSKERVPSRYNTSSTPLLGQIAAGSPLLAEENIEEYFNIDSSIKADFILRVKGDSMIDGGIQEGDLAFFHKQNQLENGEVGAIYIDGEATLKKFYKNDGTIILQAQNSAYQPIVLSNGDVRILGKLVAVLSIKG